MAYIPEVNRKEAQGRANRWNGRLDDFTVPELRQLAQVLGAYQGQRGKGGKYKPYRKAELIHSIRQRLASHPWPHELARFADLAEDLAGS